MKAVSYALCLLIAAAAFFGGESFAGSAAPSSPVPQKQTRIYDFTFTSIDGAPMPLNAYRGSVVLLVNTASLCGFTPQYSGLQKIWEDYREKGLVVLAVPSNDFQDQEPAGEADIKKFCETNFGVNFPMTSKQAVTGAGAHPLYQWLAKLPHGGAPQWNFHKYIFNREGELIESWSSVAKPESEKVTKVIEKLLAEPVTESRTN